MSLRFNPTALAKLKKRVESRKKRGKPVLTPGGGVLPKKFERQYQRELTKLTSELNQKLLESLKGRVESILEKGKRELGLKLDAYEDDISNTIRELGVQIDEQLPDATIEEIARKQGIAINAKNLAILKSQYKSITGLDFFALEPWVEAKMNAFVRENTRLITKLKTETLVETEGIIFRGVSQGKSLRDIEGEIKDRLGVNKSRAKLIARDQVASLNGELTHQRQKAAGIEKYKWQTALDERVRASHAELNGKIFSWDDPPSIGHPGAPINCRCVAIPVFDSAVE